METAREVDKRLAELFPEKEFSAFQDVLAALQAVSLD